MIWYVYVLWNDVHNIFSQHIHHLSEWLFLQRQQN